MASQALSIADVCPLPTAASLDEAVDNLLTLGYTRLYSSLAKRSSALIEGFAAITRDDRRVLLHIDDPRETHQDGTSDLGFREVRRGGAKHNPRPDEVAEGRTAYDETKYVLHYNGRALGYWSNCNDFLREHTGFFLELGLLQGECLVLGQEIAERLDQRLPGYGFAERMQKSEHMARVRLLRYLCDGFLPGIAQRHRDQDFLTIHVHSDRPQLWLADRKNENVLSDAEETRDDSILLFWGRKAWEVTQGTFQGIVHGVLDPTFGRTGRAPRHTIVSFLHAETTPGELRWAKENLHQLSIPQHITDFGSGM